MEICSAHEKQMTSSEFCHSDMIMTRLLWARKYSYLSYLSLEKSITLKSRGVVKTTTWPNVLRWTIFKTHDYAIFHDFSSTFLMSKNMRALKVKLRFWNNRVSKINGITFNLCDTLNVVWFVWKSAEQMQ